MDRKITNPDDEDGDVNGEDPHHQDEDRVDVIVKVGVGFRVLYGNRAQVSWLTTQTGEVSERSDLTYIFASDAECTNRRGDLNDAEDDVGELIWDYC